MIQKKLSQLGSGKDIPEPAFIDRSYDHCPLHTAGSAVIRIEGAMALVLGVAECAYYIKNAAMRRENRGEQLMNVVLDWNDVTFGCTSKVEAAFSELMQEYKPKAVFLVTTCVPEVTGDDIDALADSLSEKYSLPVPVVHTEHFKTYQTSAGAAGVMTACVNLMKPASQCEGVNILGRDKEDFIDSELSLVLSEAGIPVGAIIPGASTAQLQKASSACMNIVCDETALELARAMERRFDIPFVDFTPHIYPQRIKLSYEKIFCKLNLPIPQSVTAAYNRALKTVSGISSHLSGTTYFAGPTQYPLFEMNAFCIEHGMLPLLIETQELPNREDEDLQTILQHADPYIISILTSEDLAQLRNELKPSLYIRNQRHRHGKLGFAAIIDFASELTSGRYSFELNDGGRGHGNRGRGNKGHGNKSHEDRGYKKHERRRF
ncbi:MAG: nitrogenase component 1 [Lachnospiraceae bacterium]